MSRYQIVPSRPKRGCRTKRGYTSRAAAEEHLDRLVRQEGAQPFSLNVYRCGRCSRWHVGHLGTPGRTV